MKFIDLFCGMGTIRMGFERAGHECVYAVEWDKHKRRIYSVIFGHEPQGRDIADTRAADFPAADCWCFGAPCQDFSIAGLREGMEGDRSSLVREVFRLVRETPEEHRPEWLLYENVKGMLSSNKGFDYLKILFEMASLGYDIEYQLLNSKDFGVPQNRERVYTLGHLRRYGQRKIFPFGKDNGNFVEASKSEETVMYADCGVGHKWVERKSITPPLRAQGGGNAPGIAIISKNGNIKKNNTEGQFASCLTAGAHSGGNHSDMDLIVEPCVKQIGNVMPTATRDNPNQGRVYDTAGLAPCLNKMEGGGREPFIVEPIHGILFTQKKITCETEIANTLTARNPSTSRGNYTPITGISNGHRIRRLTPRECMRLQGVPDEVTDKLIAAGVSDTQMYRAAGDACTVNVIYEIAKRLGN